MEKKEILEKMLPAIRFFEIISIYLIIGIIMAIILRGLLSGNWQSWTNDWIWVISAMLLMIAYFAKECRVIILKNELEKTKKELKTKEDELRKKKTALTIATKDDD